MAPNLAPGTFKIVSLVYGRSPVGVNHTRLGFQQVQVNAPVTTWIIEKAGNATYRLRVGGYAFTGVAGNNVIASINPEQNLEWIATYNERQDAYTIAPADNKGMGWTVPSDETDPAIVLRPIVASRIPLIFLLNQLFRFEPIYRDERLYVK